MPYLATVATDWLDCLLRPLSVDQATAQDAGVLEPVDRLVNAVGALVGKAAALDEVLALRLLRFRQPFRRGA
jgi:hypothetical protein